MDCTVRSLSSHAGESVTLRGWVHQLRSSGKISFLQFRDGTGIVQVIAARDDLDDAGWETTKALNLEASVEIHGTVREDRRAPSGV